jgi:hypothetical protein
MSMRPIKRLGRAQPTVEGAGVRLRRGFGFGDPSELDTTPPVEADNRSLVVFDRGDQVTVQAGDEGIRFLLVSGKPLREPVAWYGPIVMNTQEELQQAFSELQQGTFLDRRV